jgi:hypothetical protein
MITFSGSVIFVVIRLQQKMTPEIFAEFEKSLAGIRQCNGIPQLLRSNLNQLAIDAAFISGPQCKAWLRRHADLYDVIPPSIFSHFDQIADRISALCKEYDSMKLEQRQRERFDAKTRIWPLSQIEDGVADNEYFEYNLTRKMLDDFRLDSNAWTNLDDVELVSAILTTFKDCHHVFSVRRGIPSTYGIQDFSSYKKYKNVKVLYYRISRMTDRQIVAWANRNSGKSIHDELG